MDSDPPYVGSGFRTTHLDADESWRCRSMTQVIPNLLDLSELSGSEQAIEARGQLVSAKGDPKEWHQSVEVNSPLRAVAPQSKSVHPATGK